MNPLEKTLNLIVESANVLAVHESSKGKELTLEIRDGDFQLAFTAEPMYVVHVDVWTGKTIVHHVERMCPVSAGQEEKEKTRENACETVIINMAMGGLHGYGNQVEFAIEFAARKKIN